MFSIRPMLHGDLPALKEFTDHEIGAGYYSMAELEDIFDRSHYYGSASPTGETVQTRNDSQVSETARMCSLILENPNKEIKGVRITYPPGQWTKGKGKGLNPALWPHSLEETAYFQSLFLAADTQGGGWGGKLSLASMAILKECGAKGVVCHSWKESPNNSSTRYLVKLGFSVIAEHAEYWKEVPYNCTRCKVPPCLCTAQEMYLDLEKLK